MTSSATILVVDDMPENVRLLTRLLTRAGHRVVGAGSGIEALQALAGQVPDLVMLDVDMPGMNGYEVCRSMRAERATSGVPVIIVSGMDSSEERMRAIEAGADDVVAKPFRVDDLMGRVDVLLKTTRRATTEAPRETVTDRRPVLPSANMAHNLRTPLSLIIGFTDLLRDGLGDGATAQQKEYLDGIQEAAWLLHHAIGELIERTQRAQTGAPAALDEAGEADPTPPPRGSRPT